MSALYKTSSASIVRSVANRYIRLVGYINPEVLLPPMIREYFSEIGYIDMYPFFKTLRIGAVHPFAMMLYQEVSGVTTDVNLFPSITVADTSDSETNDTLGNSHDSFMLTASDVARLKDAVNDKSILTSTGNIERMELATKVGFPIYGVKHTFRANHNIDLNIWGDNKDMVSMIFDMLSHFVNAYKDRMKEEGIIIAGAVNGRRSGDINVEFGKLLYGANLTVPVIIESSSMVVDVEVDEINKVVNIAEYSIT